METNSAERVLTTFEIVQRVVAELLGVETSEVTPDASIDSLGGDSMDTAQLILDLEEACGIDVLDDDFANPIALPVKDFVNYVDSRRAAL